MIKVIPPTIVPFVNGNSNLPVAFISLKAGVTYDLAGTIFNVLSATGAAGQTFFSFSFSSTWSSSYVVAESIWNGGTAGGTPVALDSDSLFSPSTNNAPGMAQCKIVSGTVTPDVDGDLVLNGDDYVALNGDTITVCGTLVAE